MSRTIMGIQPVREVLRARACKVHEVLVEEGRNPKLDGLSKLATDNGAEVRRVSSRELDRIAKGGRHQGVIATAMPIGSGTTIIRSLVVDGESSSPSKCRPKSA